MTLRKNAVSGIFWTFSQQIGTQGIGFVVSIILARLLVPAEFGLIGMITVFAGIGNTLIDGGLASSLIRSSSVDQEDYSTVFYFNIAGSLCIYILIYCFAPYISRFYSQPVLTSLIRVYCLSFIISAFSTVHLTRLSKAMNFKAQMTISIPSNIVSSIVGVWLALKGYGVWSLVWMNLIQSSCTAIQLWIRREWIPSLVFNIAKFKVHFRFGYKLTLSNVLNSIFTNIYQIVIGKYFSPSQVGFYTRSENLRQVPVVNIANALNKVTYPLFATIVDDDIRLRNMYRTIIKLVIFIVAPLLIYLGVLAEPVFRLLFTDKWLPAVPYFQILCIAGILYPVHAYNLNILVVKGRSDLFLKLEIVKKIAIVICVAVSIQYGIFALLWSSVFLSFSSFFINTYFTGRILRYSSLAQVIDILPIILWACVSGFLVFICDAMLKDRIDLIRIGISGLTGLSLYIVGACVFKMDAIKYIKDIIISK